MTRLALVTGASRGLGYATALALAPEHHVIAVARTVGGLEDLDDAIQSKGGSATLVPLDITDDDALARMGRAIYDRWKHLDLLVHAAAHAAPLTPSEQIAVKDLDRSFAVNARATQRIIAMLDPLLRAAPTRATAVMVVDDTTGAKFHGSYAASKAAARVFATQWAEECRRIGPRILTFAPNPMPTATRARFHPGEDRTKLSAPEVEANRLLSLL